MNAYAMTIDDDTDPNQLDEPVPCDLVDQFRLPFAVTYYWTSAPAFCDLWYTSEVHRLEDGWRLLCTTNAQRFEDEQLPLYQERHACVQADTSEAEHLGLPLRAEVSW
jgi:hypothetical protein